MTTYQNPTATCPYCTSHHAVKQAWSQATRSEGCRFLGLSVYCPTISCDVPIEPLAVEWTPEDEGVELIVHKLTRFER
jgi:hypothetical protein